MTRYRCESCQGEYDNQGGSYTHACPPGTEGPRDENLTDDSIIIYEGGTVKDDKRKIKLAGKGRTEVV